MKHNIVTPSVGESITEVSILKWHKKDGDVVKTGELLLEIESDKATVEIVAESPGQLAILKPEGERIPVGEVIATVDDSVKPGKESAPAKATAPAAASKPAPAPQAVSQGSQTAQQMGPAARKLAAEASASGVDVSQIPGTGKDGRVTKGDILGYQANPSARAQAPAPAAPATSVARAPVAGERRVPMSNIRARIAERLVQSKNTAAILTTFNEADMSPINTIRNQHKEAFKAKHGVALSYMSFFALATLEALKQVPEVNASIDGREIVYHDFYDIGIAVGSDRGLVVPVVRDAGKLSLIEIEKKIVELATKARSGKLSIAEMTGGTFTISNGGVYGSLLSTPILNPPQTGILGMHKIQDRPMAINGKVEIRPMMYLALSYDHRLIDGKEAVTFLVTLKDFLEHPEKLKLEF